MYSLATIDWPILSSPLPSGKLVEIGPMIGLTITERWRWWRRWSSESSTLPWSKQSSLLPDTWLYRLYRTTAMSQCINQGTGQYLFCSHSPVVLCLLNQPRTPSVTSPFHRTNHRGHFICLCVGSACASRYWQIDHLIMIVTIGNDPQPILYDYISITALIVYSSRIPVALNSRIIILGETLFHWINQQSSFIIAQNRCWDFRQYTR